MDIPLPGLPPLAPNAARLALPGDPALFNDSKQSPFPVPESAFAEAPRAPKALVAQDWRKAGDFTAMAIGELLQPIFDTVHLSESRFGGGAGEAAWKPILVQAIGQGIAREGGLGLTETAFRELLRQQQFATNPQLGGSPPSAAETAPQGGST